MGDFTGIYFKYNFLKYCILDTARRHSEKSITAKDIEEATGIPYSKINSALSQWKRRRCGYFRADKQHVDGTKAIKWRITQKGVRTHIMLVRRIKQGKDMNLLRKIPRKLETYGKYECKKRFTSFDDYTLLPAQIMPYIGITKKGVELGFGIAMKYQIAYKLASNTS